MAQLQRVLARHVPGFPVTRSQVPARPGAGKPSLAGLGSPAAGSGAGGAAGAAAPGGYAGGHAGSAAGAGVPRPSLADVPATASAASPRLMGAIKHAQESLQRRPAASSGAGAVNSGAGSAGGDIGAHSAPRALEEIRTRNQAFKQVLKQAASTPAERATIEIVAMMFQSILTCLLYTSPSPRD